ncbi:glycosyltransferase family 4 protein [Psychrobacter sp. Sarcosine-3u-12]|uniref:glycosyltransferase family 4 protein n=1 Tax=Psychrobacter sp. Sarcosine-3u-12 TaxID=2058325 RepID=UPI000C34D68D|nr:glycosyltransferase family 4 protein [Psychrobacter sp. Sarcosine-3u-12]PKG36544.1 glycosyltransferase family 1 protein [Psychrobacter sp. Sarcosine-3u-12]
MVSKKVLFVASVAVHLHAFHRPYLKWFHDQGYEVHVACRGAFSDHNVFKVWNIEFERSPLSLTHLSSLFELRKIINENNYSLITCHTPMASVLSRLASVEARKKGTRLIYTAHGFHFFKGGSKWSWLTYYPVEVTMSYLTDAIVCINQEDLDIISKNGSSSTDYYLIPGIGVDPSRFEPPSREKKSLLKNSLEISEDAFVMIYVAEFIERKNHRLLIDAIKSLSEKIDNFILLLAGKGILLDEIKQYVADNGIGEQVRFLGFVTDIEKHYQVSDVAISSSRQEGLGINLVEAMMCGVPVIATIDRGHRTVIDHNVNGILCPQNDPASLADAVFEIHQNDQLRFNMSIEAIEKAKKFEIKNSLEAMSKIYDKFL